MSALLDTQLDYRPAEYTRELIDLLNVIGLLVELEPGQTELLGAICEAPLISTEDLTEVGVLPVPAQVRKVPKTWSDREAALW